MTTAVSLLLTAVVLLWYYLPKDEIKVPIIKVFLTTDIHHPEQNTASFNPSLKSTNKSAKSI